MPNVLKSYAFSCKNTFEEQFAEVLRNDYWSYGVGSQCCYQILQQKRIRTRLDTVS